MLELTDYPSTGQVRIYNIEAISLPIVYNKYGDHDPNGLMYVLKNDSERIQRKAKELFELPVPQPYKEVQPLVIRANVGDTVQINFENKLNRRASVHVQGLFYDVLTSDGANVGFIAIQENTATHIGNSNHAYLRCPPHRATARFRRPPCYA